MCKKTNKYCGYRVEFHILQSFPVTCLNRDDVGAPKTASIGGSTRARVSSQCWKRSTRITMLEMNKNLKLGIRTKLIKRLILDECLKQGATPEQANLCGEKIEGAFIKKEQGKEKKADSEEEKNEKSDTLLFLSPSEIETIVNTLREKEFLPEKVIKSKDQKKQAKEIAKLIGKPNYAVDGLDIALFGRMVALATTMDVEPASYFAHAISTHKIANEVEFFTALDDIDENQGSAHMGSLEFNSATYYRYISIDLGQLYKNFAGEDIMEALEIFTKALYVAIPEARQATMSGASPWEYAHVYVRKGQRLQVPFETAIKAKEGGFFEPSKSFLSEYLRKKEKLSGTLFGKLDAFIYGENEDFSIDALISALKNSIQKI